MPIEKASRFGAWQPGRNRLPQSRRADASLRGVRASRPLLKSQTRCPGSLIAVGQPCWVTVPHCLESALPAREVNFHQARRNSPTPEFTTTDFPDCANHRIVEITDRSDVFQNRQLRNAGPRNLRLFFSVVRLFGAAGGPVCYGSAGCTRESAEASIATAENGRAPVQNPPNRFACENPNVGFSTWTA